jgi:hypothetical protein
VIFTADEYAALHAVVFRADYPGYKPNVIEAPNGDGRLDAHKRYAHVATKYLDAWTPANRRDRALKVLLAETLCDAFDHARVVAHKLNVPEAFMPSFDACALRVLEYPSGVGGEQHTDFDLFTTLCYRDDPSGLVRTQAPGADLDAFDPGLHLGEIGELVGLGPATPHYVRPADWTQRSIVFFALPSHFAVLPSGVTIGAWLAERMSRSRVPAPIPPPSDDADAWYAAELARLRERAPA